jgi:hypothetical protein
MAKPTGGAVSVAQSESRTRSSLLLESIALRHQIAVLKRRIVSIGDIVKQRLEEVQSEAEELRSYIRSP